MALDIQRMFEGSRERLVARMREFEYDIARNFRIKKGSEPDARGVGLATLSKWNRLETRTRPMPPPPPSDPPPSDQPTSAFTSPAPVEGEEGDGGEVLTQRGLTSRNEWVQKRLDLSNEHPNDTSLQNWVKQWMRTTGKRGG